MVAEDCNQLVAEAETASQHHSLDIAASIFEDASKCFDKIGDRKKSGQYLTLAGDFFLDLKMEDKAAGCFGKAIVRYLMVDDLETARILIQKGRDYGFTVANHHFKIALDSLERREQVEREQREVILDSSQEDLPLEEEVLPDIDIMPMDETLELIQLENFTQEDDIYIQRQNYIIPQLESEDPSRLGSYAVLAAVSKTTREQSKVESKIFTNALVKDSAGETKIIEPRVTLASVSQITGLSAAEPEDLTQNATVHTKKEPTTEPKAESLQDVDIASFKEPDTLDVEYAGKTEIENIYTEELVDIEIIDTIPLKFQVVDVRSDFELEQQKNTEEGVVYTWRKDKIEIGKTVSVEYTLRKRVERSIILRKENKVSVITLYHSIHQDLKTQLDFVNTTGKMLQEVLIEDVIPPELVVSEAKSLKNIRPMHIPTHDSTLYRWIFSKLTPGDTFPVQYTFRERPLTRWYRNEIETEEGVVEVEKISQPIIDSHRYEYVWMYSIINPTSDDLKIQDRIPWGFEVSLVDPIHHKPSTRLERAQTILNWHLSSNEKIISITLRIVGPDSFTPLAPDVTFSRLGEIQLVNQEKESQKKLVDIRRIQQSLKEIT